MREACGEGHTVAFKLKLDWVVVTQRLQGGQREVRLHTQAALDPLPVDALLWVPYGAQPGSSLVRMERHGPEMAAPVVGEARRTGLGCWAEEGGVGGAHGCDHRVAGACEPLDEMGRKFDVGVHLRPSAAGMESSDGSARRGGLSHALRSPFSGGVIGGRFVKDPYKEYVGERGVAEELMDQGASCLRDGAPGCVRGASKGACQSTPHAPSLRDLNVVRHSGRVPLEGLQYPAPRPSRG